MSSVRSLGVTRTVFTGVRGGMALFRGHCNKC